MVKLEGNELGDVVVLVVGVFVVVIVVVS